MGQCMFSIVVAGLDQNFCDLSGCNKIAAPVDFGLHSVLFIEGGVHSFTSEFRVKFSYKLCGC